MADISVTTADVNRVSGGEEKGIAAEAITAGQTLYKNTNGQMALFDANAVGTSGDVFIALCDAAANQPVVYALPGAVVDIGGTLTVGTPYYGSSTDHVSGESGGICPHGDLLSDEYVVHLGIAITANNLQFEPKVSGVQIP